MSDNYNDLLGGKSTPSCSFAGQYPVRWTGTILEATKKPAFEYDPSKPNNRGGQKFWPDGNPVEDLWITLQTEVRVSQEDDGRRVLVLDSKNKLEAVQAAVRESGADFAKGGTIDIEWYGVDPNGKNPQNPPKLYRARYTGPTFNGMLGGGQPAPSGQPAQAGWGAPAAAPASAPQATSGWGNPPASAPQPAAQGGWGAPAAPAQASSPGAGWGSPTPPPAEPDPTTYDEFVAAFRRKGVDPSSITSPEQAAQVWALVKNNPNVA